MELRLDMCQKLLPYIYKTVTLRLFPTEVL